MKPYPNIRFRAGGANRSLALSGFILIMACWTLGYSGEGPDSEKKEAALTNKIKWTTASEVNNFGFNVYRGDSEEGPFVKLNEKPIPGSGTSDEPNSYQFIDTTIDPHKSYYYYVESISMNGLRQKFTPTFKAPPKVKE